MSVNSKMTAIADAIRKKTGGTTALSLDQMAVQIAGIQTGTQLPALTNPGSASDLAQGKQLIGANGSVVEGNVVTVTGLRNSPVNDGNVAEYDNAVGITHTFTNNTLFRNGSSLATWADGAQFGDARADQVAQGVTFTSKHGLKMTGTALIPGGGFIFPEGAFAPVTSFTAGKQYALVAMIGGVHRYINTTEYNQYTMNATQINIAEDAGDYVVFNTTPALFTAVASGNGFLLQNGTNYLHGSTSNGTALRVGTAQTVWTVDTSETGGFSSGKYNAKEDANAVWLFANSTDGYKWSIKYETAGSFGYDREGRDNTYSTGFVPFVLYEYVAGEGEVSPVVDTSDANVTADKMLSGFSGYANGRKVEGNIQSRNAQTITPGTTAQEIPAGVYLAGKQTISAIQTQTKTATANGTVTPDAGKYLTSVTVNVPASGITPSGTRSITANGTYDVTNYASVNVNVPASGGSGLTIKSGTTTSATFDTGLSNIATLMITKSGDIKSVGLASVVYHIDGLENGNKGSYTGCSSYSSYMRTYLYGVISDESTIISITGGTVTWNGTDSAAFVSNNEYCWVAIGTE